MNNKERAKFRTSKAWKELRHYKNVEQKGIDPITLRKLTKMNNCHHLDTRAEHYNKVDDSSRFVCLNQKTHETVHFLFTYYKNDPRILERLEEYLKLMLQFSND